MKEEFQYTGNENLIVVEQGLYKEFTYVILDTGLWPTAYVAVQFPQDVKNLDLPVHGGITYTGPAHWDTYNQKLFVGWDYTHYGDFTPSPSRCSSTAGKRWTLSEVRKECYNAIDFLVENRVKPA